MSKVWSIRGVDDELQQRASAAARDQGMMLGGWVSAAIQAALARGQSSDQAVLGRWQGAPPEASPPTPGPADEIAKLKDRIAALEEREPRMSRIEALEVRIAVLEERIPSDPASASASPGAGPTETSEPLVTGGKGTRRKWSDAEDAVLRRIAAEGGTQADAVRELGRSDGTINEKWKALGLPVLPRKGRKLKREASQPVT